MLKSAGLTFLSGDNFLRFIWFSLLFLAIPFLIFAQTASVPPVPTATATSTKVPKIYCADPNFDFHNVDEGGDIVHLFHIANQGKSTLIITNVSTSCGCTAAVEDKKEIPPGGQGDITATYHTKGRPGHATKIITISSNDPVNPNYQLKLDMTVIRDIDIQPDKVYLYNVQHGQSQTSTIHIKGKPDLLLKILSAQSANGVVTVTSITPHVDQAAHQYGADLLVAVPAAQPIGSFTDTLKVQTNYKEKPELVIDVLGEVVVNFSYSPHSAFFTPHQNTPITVSFAPKDPQHFTILKAESVDHLTRAEIKNLIYAGGVTQYQVLIYTPQNAPTNSDGKDTILVTTNDLDQPQVTIVVHVTK